MEKSDAKNGTVAINGSSLADKGDNGSNGKSEDEKKKEKEEVKLVGFFEVVGKLFAPLGNFSCFFCRKTYFYVNIGRTKNLLVKNSKA